MDDHLSKEVEEKYYGDEGTRAPVASSLLGFGQLDCAGEGEERRSGKRM